MVFRNTNNGSWKAGEARKIVVSKSRRLVLWQCLVHCVPISTSIAILYVNYRGFYIGVNFPGMPNSDTMVLMLLQLAAKVHEILIVASLSQIVWHAVRHELLYGEGLPLGLIGSGLSFSSFEFYFKKDFYGSLGYLNRAGQKLKRVGFVILLVISGVTAILCGPASAVLLVPKSDTYAAGGTDFYLNGSAGHFWPEDLSENIDELQAICSGDEFVLNDVCPAGGFVSLWERWRDLQYLDPAGTPVATFANDLSGSRFYWPVHSSTTKIPPLYTLGDPRLADGDAQSYTWLVQAHAASAIVLDRLTQDWWQALLAVMNIKALQVKDRNIGASAPSAFAAVRCGDARNVSSSTEVMSFPSIQGRWDWGQDLEFNITSANLSQSESLRFQWIQLPREFGVVSIGGLFELPWTKTGDSRVVVGCSAQTGWLPTELRTDAYTFWSGWYPFGLSFGERTPAWTAISLDQPLSPTNGRIALGQAWLDLLTPKSPSMPGSTDNQSVSTIEAILIAAGTGVTDVTSDGVTEEEAWTKDDQSSKGGKKRLLESIIANVLVNGLSRSGSHRVFQQGANSSSATISTYLLRDDFEQRIVKGNDALVRPPGDLSSFTVLHASMLISGYAFQSTLPGSLAVSVLLVHMVLALVHVVWIVIRQRVSRSWDSIAELVVLAQNSQPVKSVLQNTGAGIGLRHTHATMARIRVLPWFNDEQNDHVELIFEDRANNDTLRVDPETSHDSVPLESFQQIPVDDAVGQNVVHESWTFPIDSRRKKYGPSGHSHVASDSTEQLLLRKRSNAAVEGLVHLDRAYG